MNDYLMHHGIKGQKWGVRRFQREDGTRTEAGKRRYRTNFDERKTMSDEELLRRIGRLEKEKRLMDLERDTDDRAHAEAAKILKTAGKASAIVFATGATTLAIKAGGKFVGNRIGHTLGKGDLGTTLIKNIYPKKK